MDPTLGAAEQAKVTDIDFKAFDAIGYNFVFDPGLTDNSFTTAMIEARLGVPEPGQWSLAILGFGLAGAALRRGRRPTARA
ncbi:MAG: PEP-CTERM sorting domain-containing protein [Proteobacteria bacterium]|nr:PEP-CTERM sorting domain-containing protein [Pseudomonadota bacterium]